MADDEVANFTERALADLLDTDLLYLTDAAGTIDRKIKVLTLLGARTKVKQADESVNNAGSGSTLQDDNELLMALLASTTYAFEATVFATSTSATPDIKYAFTVPAGATLLWSVIWTDAGGAVNNEVPVAVSDTPVTATGITANGITVLRIVGLVITAGTAGNLTFRWAQNAANATSTTVKAGSSLTVRRT